MDRFCLWVKPIFFAMNWPAAAWKSFFFFPPGEVKNLWASKQNRLLPSIPPSGRQPKKEIFPCCCRPKQNGYCHQFRHPGASLKKKYFLIAAGPNKTVIAINPAIQASA
ncbi:hypothetical protein [Chitinophaga sp.]|uniref:hypothetical protein n=1 Tax=Chitinophaga sp. TaxID=1869181 RepID=UPI0031E2AA0F